MQPPKTSEELEEMYPDLEPWQRDELEVWHRGWITKLMTGESTSEEYNAATPPHPDPHHPEEDEQKTTFKIICPLKTQRLLKNNLETTQRHKWSLW